MNTKVSKYTRKPIRSIVLCLLLSIFAASGGSPQILLADSVQNSSSDNHENTIVSNQTSIPAQLDTYDCQKNSSYIVTGNNVIVKNIKFTSSDDSKEELVLINNANNVIIRNCIFDSLSRKNSIKIIGNCSNITIDNCIFQNSVSARIKLYNNVSGVTVSNCTFDGNGTECISKTDSVNTVGHDFKILNNQFNNSIRMGVELLNFDGITISDNKFLQAQQYYLLSIPGCSNVQVYNNYFTGSTDNCNGCIEIGSSRLNKSNNIIIADNTFEALGGARIIETNTISGPIDNININGNTFSNCKTKQACITVDKNVSNEVITENTFNWKDADCTTMIYSSGSSSIFSKNHIYIRNAQAPIAALGENSTFKANDISIGDTASDVLNKVPIYLNNGAVVLNNTINLNNKISYCFGDGNKPLKKIRVQNNNITGAVKNIFAVRPDTEIAQ